MKLRDSRESDEDGIYNFLISFREHSEFRLLYYYLINSGTTVDLFLKRYKRYNEIV